MKKSAKKPTKTGKSALKKQPQEIMPKKDEAVSDPGSSVFLNV